jgi:WD40 repeat protein
MSGTGAAAGGKLKTFISYSRQDLAFADQLVAVLEWQGFLPIIDRKGIHGAERWEERLGQLILEADIVVFVLSPASAESPVCAWEVEEAGRRNKRIIPVLCRPLEGQQPHPRLRDLNYIHFYEEKDVPGSGFGTGQVRLIEALSVDIEWLREHTRLEELAARWDAGGRIGDQLLRGSELAAYKAWRDRRPANAPELTALQRAFLGASEEEEANRAGAERKRLDEMAAAQAEREKALAEAQAAMQRAAEAQKARARALRLIQGGAAVAALLVILGVSGFAIQQQRSATVQQVLKDAAIEQRRQTQITESGLLANAANAAYGNGEDWGAITKAVLLAVEAMPDEAASVQRPHVTEAELQLDNANRGLKERLMLAHEDTVRAARFSPDGTRIVTASFDKTARIWDAGSGKELARLAHEEKVYAAAFSPDGTKIVTASGDTTARIWDAGSGKELARLAHKGTVRAAAFSPEGARIVTASDDKTARLWDAGSGKELARLAHEGGVWAAAFSPEGARIVTASDDKTARLWDAGSGKELARLAHEGGVWAAAFSPEGARIVTASDDKTARLWDAGSGKELARLAHEHTVRAAGFSPDGTRIVTASWDKTARIWDAGSSKELARLAHEDRVWAAGFSPDGTRIVTASWDKTARIWNADSGKELARLAQEDRVYAAEFSPDSIKIVTASWDKTARIWDAGRGKELARLAQEDWAAGRGKKLAEFAHGHTLLAVTFSPDRSKIVTASLDKTARIWNAGSGEELARLAHDEDWVYAAAFSPDGTRIVTASLDKTARIWDAGSGKELARLAHEEGVYAADFSPAAGDGFLRIITLSGDEARVWEVARSAQDLVNAAKRRVARCLGQGERAQYFLPPAPPIWCITGPGLEAEKDPAKWQPKWPYQSAAWRDWLAAKQRGEERPVPKAE